MVAVRSSAYDLVTHPVVGARDAQHEEDRGVIGPLILVVDDNPDVTQFVALLLETQGYRTQSAQSGEAALRTMEEDRPDLILCDIMMPGMNGFDVFQRVRADRRWRSIPFAFLTALSDSQVRMSSAELGVEAYLTKPFSKQELLALVSGLLRRARELQTYTESEMDSFKSQLLFMITHELNTPLSVIRMLTDSLRGGYQRMSRAQLGDYVDLLARSSEELSYIVESMLLALQIDSGRAQELFDAWAAPQMLRMVLEAVMAHYSPRARDRGVSLAADGLQTPVWVLGHEQQLMQIFGRILDNSIRFSPKDAAVNICVEPENSHVLVTFTDRGPGMAPEELHTAFERLHQINRERQEQQGVGLSLSLVRSLAEIHGGDITVRSVPGQGSAFTVKLPVVAAPV
jgi:signal transduction histidine kinase